jgi:hypothetical protein
MEAGAARCPASPLSPTTKPDRLNQQTAYSLQCTALDSSTYQESTTVNLVPAYPER